jgi:hypothetical protein
VGDDSHLVLHQKLLGEVGSLRRGVVMVKQPCLFPPKFGATSSYIFTQWPQNVAVEPGIHLLACWVRCFALPQLLYRWWHQSGIFLIPHHIFLKIILLKFITFHYKYSNTTCSSFTIYTLVTLYIQQMNITMTVYQSVLNE